MKHEGFKNETENIIISILIYENKLITIISVWSEQNLKKLPYIYTEIMFMELKKSVQGLLISSLHKVISPWSKPYL